MADRRLSVDTNATLQPCSPMQSPARKYRANSWAADLAASVSEFIGTFLFLFLGLGSIQVARNATTQAGNGLGADFLLMASTGMAVSLTCSVWLFFRVCGAAFNPQVALTLLLLGAIPPRRFAMYVVAQLLGGVAAAAVLRGMLPGPLDVNTAPMEGMGVAQALFYEMFLTFGLCMTVVMVAFEKTKGTFLIPIAIGGALFATQLAGIGPTGGAVNTARAFGPAMASGDFTSHHWIYWVGPSLGAVLAAALYKLLVFLHYWELAPGADASSAAEAAMEPVSPVLSRETKEANTAKHVEIV